MVVMKREDRLISLKLREAWRNQRTRAKQRGIPFLLTYKDWLFVWESSGKLSQRGRWAHQYCMSRMGDKGPYAIENVVIKTISENSSEASLVQRRPRPPRTRQHCENIAKALRGRKLSAEHINNMKKAHALRLGKTSVGP